MLIAARMYAGYPRIPRPVNSFGWQALHLRLAMYISPAMSAVSGELVGPVPEEASRTTDSCRWLQLMAVAKKVPAARETIDKQVQMAGPPNGDSSCNAVKWMHHLG